MTIISSRMSYPVAERQRSNHLTGKDIIEAALKRMLRSLLLSNEITAVVSLPGVVLLEVDKQ